MAQGVGRGEKHLVVGARDQCGGVVKEAIGRGRWGRGLECHAKELGPSPVGQQFPASSRPFVIGLFSSALLQEPI